MEKITKEQYEFAKKRVEELLPLVDDNMPVNDPQAIELVLMSEVVIGYEKEHFPIEKPTFADVLELAIEEKGFGKSELARQIEVSPSRVSDYLAGRSLPTLPIAALISRVLGISRDTILSAC